MTWAVVREMEVTRVARGREEMGCGRWRGRGKWQASCVDGGPVGALEWEWNEG